MSKNPIDRLARANPIPELSTAALPERLRCLIESDVESASTRSPQRSRRHIPPRALASVPVAIGAAVVALVLLAGSSSSGLNVAAAAYTATAPKHGTVEIVALIHIYRGREAGATLRQQEWTDASGQHRRELDTIVEAGHGTQGRLSDWSFAPHAFEHWSSGPDRAVVDRYVGDFSEHYPDHLGFGFDGVALDGVEGIKLYRTSYREGLVRLVGHEWRGGHKLWKLESRTGGQAIDGHTRLIVLVDPHTFLPVFERQIDLSTPGHPAIVESELLSYRTLEVSSAADRSVFDLISQHPGTRMLTQSATALGGRSPSSR